MHCFTLSSRSLPHFPFLAWAIATVLLAQPMACASRAAEPRKLERILVPELDGDWWRIAENDPDVSPYVITRHHGSNACDFTIFQDANGTWNLISCIRGTSAPGERVFHRWTSNSLDKPNWKAAGIFDAPRNPNPYVKNRIEYFSQQAPHGFRHGDTWYIFYNSRNARGLYSPNGCDWKKEDGEWNILRNDKNEEILFEMGRDVMLFQDRKRSRWMAYYCGMANVDGARRGAMIARTAPDLHGPWSVEELVIRTEGNPESPFVVELEDAYYLFQQMEVFVSDTPERFEGKPIAHLTGQWFHGKYAPEIVEHKGQYYVAGYGGGIWLCRLKWVPRMWEEVEAWRKGKYAEIETIREEKAREREAAAKPKNE